VGLWYVRTGFEAGLSRRLSSDGAWKKHPDGKLYDVFRLVGVRSRVFLMQGLSGTSLVYVGLGGYCKVVREEV